MKRVTYVCDRCGKDVEPDDVVYLYLYVRGNARRNIKIADICGECYAALKDQLKEIFARVVAGE